MPKPILTIGMAVHEDYHGVFFTINALRLYHPVADCELLVVDNSPDTESGKHTRGAVENCAAGWGSVRYVPAAEVLGTSAPRERIFREAQGEAVLCLDCHVLLFPGAIARLKQYYAAHPDTRDILSGPLVFDNLVETATHFTPRWREEMEGTWGLAWKCQCGKIIDVIDEPQQTTTMYRALMGAGPFKTEYRCNCGNTAPACEWARHEEKLIAAGWQPTGMRPSDEPFEIPGQGLGLFSCRKESWLGFNPHFRGFGGEELYIHRKFRQAGAKALCLPFLGWYHRFAPAAWTRYRRERYGKARNYVLGHQETGLDIEPVRREFVQAGRLSTTEWEHLVADPIGHEKSPAVCTTCGGNGQALAISEAELPAKDRQRFAGLAAGKRVVVFGKRDWWRPVIADGGPASLTFYPASGAIPAIDECDLLVIHSVHHADNLLRELAAMAPKTTQRILLRSSHAFGENAEGGGPGLLAGLRKWMQDNPEWHVVEHSTENWGYTIASRAAEDRKPLPGVFTMAVNLAKALAAHVANGLESADTPTMEARLNVCTLCDQRNEDRCSACGCFVAAKAAMQSSVCPLGKWPAMAERTVEASGEKEL